MHSADAMIANSFHIEDSPELLLTFDCVKDILDAKYKLADLEEVTKTV